MKNCFVSAVVALPLSVIGFDAYALEAGDTPELPVSKQLYKGTTVDGILHPANEFFVPAISKLADEWIHENGAAPAPYKNAILIRPDTMVLVYVDFDEENPKYDFYLQTTVSRSPDFRSFFASDAPPHLAQLLAA